MQATARSWLLVWTTVQITLTRAVENHQLDLSHLQSKGLYPLDSMQGCGQAGNRRPQVGPHKHRGTSVGNHWGALMTGVACVMCWSSSTVEQTAVQGCELHLAIFADLSLADATTFLGHHFPPLWVLSMLCWVVRTSIYLLTLGRTAEQAATCWYCHVLCSCSLSVAAVAAHAVCRSDQGEGRTGTLHLFHSQGETSPRVSSVSPPPVRKSSRPQQQLVWRSPSKVKRAWPPLASDVLAQLARCLLALLVLVVGAAVDGAAVDGAAVAGATVAGAAVARAAVARAAVDGATVAGATVDGAVYAGAIVAGAAGAC